MNIDISEHFKVSDILSAVKEAEEGSHIYCSSDRHFSLLKICLVKLQKIDLNIYLLDQHGFTIKQVSARKKGTSAQAAVNLTVVDSSQSVTEQAPTTEVIGAVVPAVTSVVAEPPTAPLSNLNQKSVPATAPVSFDQGMSNKQISVLRDLEQALRRCKEQELLVIGFSDGLVAVPEALGYGADAISSADALEIEAFDVYRGYEADSETAL